MNKATQNFKKLAQNCMKLHKPAKNCIKIFKLAWTCMISQKDVFEAKVFFKQAFK